MPKPANLEGLSEDQIATMASLYRSVVTNPETREMALVATKKAHPEMSIPELDVKEAIRAEMKTHNERLEAEVAERIRRDAEQRVRDERAALRDKGYSLDQVAAIEKIMMEKHIPSYAQAAEFFDLQNRVAEPTPSSAVESGSTFQLPPSPLEAMKKGRFGVRDWARNEATQALNDLRAGRVKLH